MNGVKKFINNIKPITNQISNVLSSYEGNSLQYFEKNRLKGKDKVEGLSEEKPLKDSVLDEKEGQEENVKSKFIQENPRVENSKACSTIDLKLNLDENSIIQGIIFSEILGQPKCKTRRRSSRSDTL